MTYISLYKDSLKKFLDVFQLRGMYIILGKVGKKLICKFFVVR